MARLTKLNTNAKQRNLNGSIDLGRLGLDSLGIILTVSHLVFQDTVVSFRDDMIDLAWAKTKIADLLVLNIERGLFENVSDKVVSNGHMWLITWFRWPSDSLIIHLHALFRGIGMLVADTFGLNVLFSGGKKLSCGLALSLLLAFVN